MKECNNSSCSASDTIIQDLEFCTECGGKLTKINDLFVHPPLDETNQPVRVEDLVAKRRDGSLHPQAQVYRKKWGDNWQPIQKALFDRIKIPEQAPVAPPPPDNLDANNSSEQVSGKSIVQGESKNVSDDTGNSEPSKKENDKVDNSVPLKSGKVMAGGDAIQNITVSGESSKKSSLGNSDKDASNSPSLETGKVLAGGNVTQNITQNTQTNIIHEDDTTKSVKCVVSNVPVLLLESGHCSKCDGAAKLEFFNQEKKLCQNCEKKERSRHERTFRQKVRECLDDDHKIDDEEKLELDRLSVEFGFSQADVKRFLDEGYEEDRLANQQAMSSRDSSNFKKAQRALNKKNDPKAAFDLIGKLVAADAYPSNKELAKFFLLVAAEADPESGLSFLEENELFAGKDSSLKSVRKLEMLDALEQQDEADKVERNEFPRFPGDALVLAKTLERKIDLFLEDDQEEDEREDVLNFIDEINWEEVKNSDEPDYKAFIQFIEEYVKLFKGERNDLNPSSDDDPARVFLLRKQRQGFGVSDSKPLQTGEEEIQDQVAFDLPPPADFSGVKNGTYENGDRYEGNWVNGKKEGIGNLVSDISKYEGYWKADKRHGMGKETFDDNSRYEGEYADDFFEGPGKQWLSDGRRYEGQFKNDKWNGQGSIFSKEGKLLYQGEMENNYVHGKAKKFYPDGKVEYEGEFKDGDADGHGTQVTNSGHRFTGEFSKGFWVKGTLHLTEGQRIEGEFKDGLPHGNGKDFDKSGNMVYEGKLFEGKYHGVGQAWLPDGRSFKGEFDKGEWGKGTLFFKNGSRIEGVWKDGRLDGLAKSFYADGKPEYEGEYVSGNWQGKGTYYFQKDGESLQGNWLNGEMHGAFIRTYPDGRTVSENWQNGERVNETVKTTQTQNHQIQTKELPKLDISRFEPASYYIKISNEIVQSFWQGLGRNKGKVDVNQFKAFMFQNLAHYWKGLSSYEDVEAFNPDAWNQMIADSGGVQAKAKNLAQLIPEIVYPGMPRRKKPTAGLFLSAIFGPLGFLYTSKKAMYWAFAYFIVLPGIAILSIPENIRSDDRGELVAVTFLMTWLSAAGYHAYYLENRNIKVDPLWKTKGVLMRFRYALLAFVPPIFLLGTISNSGGGSTKNEEFDSSTQQSVNAQDGAQNKQANKLESTQTTGSSTGQVQLANASKLYQEGYNFLHGSNGVTQNLKKGSELLNQAAREGSHKAAYHLALCFYTGKALNKNPKAARQWFEYAAKLGSPKAKEFLKKWDAYSKENNQ